MQDKEVGDRTPPGGSLAAERRGNLFQFPEQKMHPIVFIQAYRQSFGDNAIIPQGIKVRVITGGIILKDDIMRIYKKVHRGEDVWNGAPEQRDKPKNQSGKMRTSLQ